MPFTDLDDLWVVQAQLSGMYEGLSTAQQDLVDAANYFESGLSLKGWQNTAADDIRTGLTPAYNALSDAQAAVSGAIQTAMRGA